MDVLLASGLALSLCYAGLSGLCLAMNRHHQQVWARKAAARQHGLRIAGWLLLALALWPCVLAWGAAVGMVLWLGWLALGGLLSISWGVKFAHALPERVLRGLFAGFLLLCAVLLGFKV